MLDTETAASHPSPGHPMDKVGPPAQNAELSRPVPNRFDETAITPHGTANWTEQLISNFSRTMGPVGLLSCLYILGWWTLHVI